MMPSYARLGGTAIMVSIVVDTRGADHAMLRRVFEALGTSGEPLNLIELDSMRVAIDQAGETGQRQATQHDREQEVRDRPGDADERHPRDQPVVHHVERRDADVFRLLEHGMDGHVCRQGPRDRAVDPSRSAPLAPVHRALRDVRAEVGERRHDGIGQTGKVSDRRGLRRQHLAAGDVPRTAKFRLAP